MFVVLEDKVVRYEIAMNSLVEGFSPYGLLRQRFTKANQCLSHALMFASGILVPAALIGENLLGLLIATAFFCVELNHPAAVDTETRSFVADFCLKVVVIYGAFQPKAVYCTDSDSVICHVPPQLSSPVMMK